MRQRGLDDPERCVDVGLHRCIKILLRQVEDRLTRLLPAGVTDDNVQPAEPDAQQVIELIRAEER
jgi:hypothetical protein